MTAIPRQLPTAAGEISPEDVEHALHSASAHHRRHTLASMGIRVNATRVSPALCRDFLARLQRAPLETRLIPAARHLTHPLVGDLVETAYASPHLRSRILRPVTDFWSPALLRLALLAHASLYSTQAEIWLWACDQQWFTNSCERQEELQNLRRAALRVHNLDGSAEFREDGRKEVRDEETPAASEDLPDAGNLGSLADALERLDACLAQARKAADRTADALERENCPDPGDVHAVQQLVNAFDHARRLVSTMAAADADQDEDVPAQQENRSLSALRQQARSVQHHHADESLREELGALAGLEATAEDAGLKPAVEAARDSAAELRARRTWDDAERQAARSLRALITMIGLEPSAPDYSDRLVELQPQFVQGSSPAWMRLGYDCRRLALNRPGESTADGPVEELLDTEEPGEKEARTHESPTVAVRPPAAPEKLTKRVETAAVTTAERAHDGHDDDNPAARPPEPPRSSDIPAPAGPPAPASPAGAADRGATQVSGSGGAASSPPAHTPLAAFIAAERYSLASALAEATAESTTRIAVLRICAWSMGLASDTGSCAGQLRAAVQELDVPTVAADPVDRLLAATALLHTAVLTGDPGAGGLLDALADRLPPRLGDAARAVGRRAQRGILTDCPVLSVAADTAGLETELAEARTECRLLLTGIPKFGFRPASAIARNLLAPEGRVGRLLSLVAEDRREQHQEIGEEVRTFTDPALVRGLVDEVYWQVVKSGNRPLEGRNRNDLVRAVLERMRPVQAWVSCVRQLQAKGSWAAQEARAMLDEVLSAKDETLAQLAEGEAESDPLRRAAAQAAGARLRHVCSLLEGRREAPAQELPAGLARAGELLKIPGFHYDESSGEVLGKPTMQAVCDAADRTWEQAARAHVAAERFDTAHQLLELAGRGLLPGIADDVLPDNLDTVIRNSGKLVAEELARAAEVLERRLRTSRVHNVVDETTERALEHRLRDAEPTPDRNLAAVRSEQAALNAELNRAWERERARFRARLEELPDAAEADRERVRKLLRDGDLLTAEQILNSLAKGEGIPALPDRGEFFHRFFPAVPDALVDGITQKLVETVRARGAFAGLPQLSFSRLSRENAMTTADALEAWRQMALREGKERREGLKESELLAPALRLLGLRNPRPVRQDRLPFGKDHRFLVLPGPEPLGDAPVPEFGSARGHRLHILLVWGEPEPKRLQSWIEDDKGGAGLIVAHFGTLAVGRRAELAALAVGNPRPVIVLDDAALAYLAAHGDGQWDSTLRVLLPFSAVNPYLSKKRAQVPREMFFGRRTELEEISSPRGSQVVYGGRGLGKSALLQEAGNRFLEQNPRARCRISLSLDSAGFGTLSPAEQIWGLIGQELERAEVLSVSKKARRLAGSDHAQVEACIVDWLEGDSDRELLVLLDEADKFFDSDAPEFLQTRRLRDLGRSTRDRVKVVFAGLRSVQRFTAAANSPFSHLAQEPVVVGPLKPADAAELLVQPLAALGYRFEDDDVVHSVLGHCSYQPYLIQMFAHRLVRDLHRRRRMASDSGLSLRPPYTILRSDVSSVQSDERLRESITDTFRDTLRLDPRYTVIANATAYHAYQHTLEATMRESELRAACLDWWPNGFRNLNPDEFRAYLIELEGLGVLARDRDRRGWHLSSTNALGMIGGLSSVENELMSAADQPEPERFAAAEPRHRLTDGTFLPLTAEQVTDLLRRKTTQARVVLGTPATGVDVVADRLRRCAADNGWHAPTVAGRGAFRQALVEGRPGERRVIIDDLTGKSPAADSCQEAVEWALTRLPTGPDVHRSAVVVAGPGQWPLWTAVLGPDCPESLGVVLLRRYTEHGLRARAVEQQQFTSESAFPRLLELTGGWPLLVDRAMATGKESQGLEEFQEWLDSRQGAEEFLTACGVGGGSVLRPAFATLAGFFQQGEGNLPFVDLAELVEEYGTAPEATTAPQTVQMLHSMGLFRRDGTDSHGVDQYIVDPVVLRCWRNSTL
ncbi:hypothetical protein [Streptomyces sp. YIM 98790]|uniref:hypothetical protein n=1 Tax=Streptomyces sp. YIM 98790 TaxID=2689077 RepID=UPI00140BB4AA|nr:hypothetical protein [Streptomyces sp. YIM 98790]